MTDYFFSCEVYHFITMIVRKFDFQTFSWSKVPNFDMFLGDYDWGARKKRKTNSNTSSPAPSIKNEEFGDIESENDMSVDEDSRQGWY